MIKVLIIIFIALRIAAAFSLFKKADLYQVELYDPELIQLKDTLIDLEYLKENLHRVERFKYVNIKVDTFANNYIKFTNEIYNIEIQSSRFHSNEHLLEYHKIDSNFLISIDGQKVYGKDGDLPSTQIDKIKIIMKGIALEFPKSLYSNLYEPNLICYDESNCFVNAHIHPNGNILLFMKNGDGAGVYNVLFIIDNNGEILKI